MLGNVEVLSLLDPVSATDAGVTGSWVDLQGYVNPGGRAIKFFLNVVAGDTAGTAGGTIQHADTTAGANAATIATFDTVTSAGGDAVAEAVAGKRYVRYLGTVATDADMTLSCGALVVERASP